MSERSIIRFKTSYQKGEPMDTLFPTTIINYIGAFASAFAANNFIYFRGFVLGFLLLGE